MPSVAQGPLTNGVDFVHKDKVGEPLISGFTAVNGRGSPPQAHRTNGVNGVNGTNGTNGMTSDTIHVRPLSQQSLDETQDQKIPVSQKDDWQFASPNGNGARVVTPPSSYSRESVESSENRKRSSPDDEEENSYHPHDTTANPSRRRVDTYESTPRDNSPNTIPHGLPMSIEHTPQHSYQGVNGERSDRNWPTRDSVGAMNDSQFAEALQRESRSMESPSGGADGSPEDSSMTAGGDMQNAAERSSTTEITRAGVQVDPKKRKRQFANRTKTGCQTCRRRKKKCDEAKPECSNCLRGGFICEGYANKATWTKPSISKGHVPLQAKDSFSEQSTLYHRHGHAREGYVNSNQPPPQQIDGVRARPIVVEEHDRQPARNPWSNPWPENHHRPYTQEHTQAPEYSHPPPIAAHPRPQHPGHPGEYEQHPGPAAIAQRPPAPQAYNHTQNVQNINSSQSALTAQLALQRQAQTAVHPPQAPPPPQAAPPAQPLSQKSEKEKMLSGEWYKLFGPQLVDEREQCKAYLFRFNNSTNPNVGVSREERARLFRAVLEAPWARNANSPNSPNGSLGRDVCVEAPFTCDYGYNINIGDEVVIGSNCTILDPCRIVIGARTIIGPNVNIFGNTVSTDPRARKGSQGTAIGSPISIEEDVYIGGNVTILPGVRIGKGSTVGAGSVVTHDVPRFTVALGNPARVKRGIWLNENN